MKFFAKNKRLIVNLVVTVYLLFGLLQFFYALDYFMYVKHFSKSSALFVSGILSYVPFVGTILGVYALCSLHHMSNIQSLALFSPIIFDQGFVLFLIIIGFFKKGDVVSKNV